MNKPKDYRIPIGPLQWDSNDSLAAEHEVVAQLVKESVKDGRLNYNELDLDFTEAGKKIRDAMPAAPAENCETVFL